MKRFKITVATFMVALFGLAASSAALVPAVPVAAYDPLAKACEDGNKGASEVCDSKDKDTASKLIANIVGTLLFVVGALSTTMIIVAGILYATSTGDSGRVSRAKNTLTYSVVGLVVSLLAYAIVKWVIGIF